MLKNRKSVLARVCLCVCASIGAAIVCACSSPCDGPGRLCAPVTPNTSGAAVAPATHPVASPAAVQTFGVDTPVAAAHKGAPVRIALLLPLRSEGLGNAAQALRAGFMAAFERDRDGLAVDLVETGDGAQEILDAYAAAVDRDDIVVGPLSRSAVTAVASSPMVGKPTIALNHPEQRGGGADIALPQRMLVMGLSIEDEARQVARWAASEQPGASALVAGGTSSWQRRVAAAFAEQWRQLGWHAQVLELEAPDGVINLASLANLKATTDTDHPALLFAALDAAQLRQVRVALGNALPVYGTSSINPGRSRLDATGAAVGELDGIHLVDLPWELESDHPAVMTYPRRAAGEHGMDMDRLYALGIDAFRVARELALRRSGTFVLDGVTGHLTIGFGRGPAHFERRESAAVLRGGAFTLVPVTP
jgi:uncharacterized protein